MLNLNHKSIKYHTPMKKNLIVMLSLLMAITTMAQKASKLWETPPNLEIPESVYLSDTLLYVSNVSGSPLDKNGKGFISRLSHHGTCIDQKWVTGLNAPKGIGLYKGLLYVSDIDRVAVIDVDDSTRNHFIELSNAKFLNDVAISPDGLVAVSDMMDNAVYMIQNDSVQQFLQDEKLNGVNGLFFVGDTLYIGTDNIIYRYPTASENAQLEVYIQNTGGIDGLERYDESHFIISDWSGKVQIVSTDEAPVEILNFTDEHYNAADINFDVNTKTLYIPTFFGNTVAAYKIE